VVASAAIFGFRESIMSVDSNIQKSPLDIVKWILAVALMAAAVVGNYLYASEPLLYRVLGVVVLMLSSVGVAFATTKGQIFLQFLKAANLERRKVIWPTRQETTQTTLIVVVVVVLMSLVLWAVDSLLSWLISLLLG
jgi:preprotein translocase subunit SecE